MSPGTCERTKLRECRLMCFEPLDITAQDLSNASCGEAKKPSFECPSLKSDNIVKRGFRFGVAEEELFDCLILFESKLTITDAAFGQVIRYWQNLCPKAVASAILFDRTSFWLIKSYKSVVVKIQKALWVNKGSRNLFRNFITANMSPWVTRLTNACSSLCVDVVEGDAFLGRGTHSRVFKVSGLNGELFALKIVEKSSIGRLYQERKALAEAERTKKGLTISPVRNCVEIKAPDGGCVITVTCWGTSVSTNDTSGS